MFDPALRSHEAGLVALGFPRPGAVRRTVAGERVAA